MKSTELPVAFTESFKYPGARQVITFSADSYMQWIGEIFPQFAGVSPIEHTEAKKLATPVGDYLFFLRKFPTHWMQARWIFTKERLVRSALEIYRGTTPAYCNFDAEIGIPILCKKSDLSPWMSLTPNEVITQRGQIRRAKGNVAMAGLGLGWAAERVLDRKAVKHLTVVERCPEVVQAFGDRLRTKFGDRVTFVCSDAYDAIEWHKFDVCLWDIWAGIGDARYDSKFQAIKARCEDFGKVCVGWSDINA